MDDRYETFAMADATFYDAMHSQATAGESFGTAARPLPDGWRTAEQDDWLTFRTDDATLPAQGWKIHASATMDSADRVLDAVWDYCLPRGIQFKFLRSPNALRTRLSKYAPRGYSGKLATVYPPDDAACQRILDELGAELAGVPGPYILSDLRWGDGPLHVRYGAFSNRYTVTDGGDIVEAVVDPDGNLVPDRRDPVFRVPPWIELPDFLAPHLKARNATTVTDMPYDFERVLHFSNGGGIYLAREKESGRRVVLKEGRPHAGLDGWGADAVQRVEHEYEVLSKLAGISGVPEVYRLFWLGEHRFLAMEYIDGEVLSKAVVSRYPLIEPNAAAADFERFAEWAMSVHEQITATMDEIHRRDLVYYDLHLFNVVVRRDDGVCLLDFEVAGPADAKRGAGLGNQGFAAPRDVTGVAADRYSLACLKLALFLPMTNLLGLHRLKARQFAEIIADWFPVPDGYLDDAVDVIAPPHIPDVPTPRITPRRPDWHRLREEITKSIVASASPERDDRLFPGDVEQFATGGLGLAYGAAGVLYALSATGAGRYERFERWLLEKATNPGPGSRMGLYDGLHGAAFALDHLGNRQAALDIVEVFLSERWEGLGSDLGSGLAGAGLNLLHLADGEPRLRQAGLRCAELVAERGAAADDESTISGGGRPYAGLLRGGAGRALLMLRAFEATGDSSFLDGAAEALRADLRRCMVRPSGAMEVNEGWRTMPYLDMGSIGIGMVLDVYLELADDESFAAASAQICRAAQSPMYILPGLFNGRSGILLYLAGRARHPLTDPQVRRQIDALSWHALPYAGGVAFPGTGLLRLSMDLATGGAGVLLALGSVLHSHPVGLPLLPSAASRPSDTRAASVR